MSLKKFIALTLLAIALLVTHSVSANSNFETGLISEYKISPTGLTSVKNEISITNNVTERYAKSFDFVIANSTLENLAVTNSAGEDIPFEAVEDGDAVRVRISFKEPVVGVNETNTFYVSYQLTTVANLFGKVWEVVIPKITDKSNFDTYTVSLQIPNTFGELAYVSPAFSSQSAVENYRIYTFSKSTIGETSINVAFGEFQAYSFDLTYHLENPLYRGSKVDIALPPDTSFQRVAYTKLDPKPDSVAVDADGNWLATYNLTPRQRVDVVAQGRVKVFAQPISFFVSPEANLAQNLKPTPYWQTTDPEIIKLAASLTTPKNIYEYVVNTLIYDRGRVAPNVIRKGALSALASPDSAICMEFTDLFIALSRAAGIPAREVNGFAYTENPDLQPVGLVADVLHSWPEYWDASRSVWVPVDPTWGATSNVDYFNKLDLKHIAFVIHGVQDNYPYPAGSYKLGPNPQKDVFVNLGATENVDNTNPEIVSKVKLLTSFTDASVTTTLTNTTPSALYNSWAKVYFDDKEVQTHHIAVLPPYGKDSFDSKIPRTILGKDTPLSVRIEFAGASVTLPSFRSKVILSSLVTLFTIAIAVIGVILLATGKLGSHGRSWKKKVSGNQS